MWSIITRRRRLWKAIYGKNLCLGRVLDLRLQVYNRVIIYLYYWTKMFNILCRIAKSKYLELLRKFEEKQSELCLCIFIIQQCLFLLWAHLDFYVRYVHNNSYERPQNDLMHTIGKYKVNIINVMWVFIDFFLYICRDANRL